MHRAHRIGVGLALVAAGLTACQVVSLRRQFDAQPPVRLTGLAPTETGALRLEFTFHAPVQGLVLSSHSAEAVLGPVASVQANPEAPVTTWDDPAALETPGVRYYRVGATMGGSPWVDRTEWALFTRARVGGQRDLLSVPVDLGAGNRLDGELGRQLAWRGVAGQTTNDADRVSYLTTDGRWRVVYLKAQAEGAPQWVDAVTETPAVVTIVPGQAFWHARAAGAGTVMGAFWGRTYTNPTPVLVRLDARGGTPLGLPWSRPLRHSAPAAVEPGQAVGPDPLGFGVLGSGGTTSDPRRPDEGGDQLWFWRDGEWLGYFWLMAHLGPERDGRWWDSRRRGFGEFSLEPGVGYYYRHRPNRWGGADFVWNPPVMSENIDN